MQFLTETPHILLFSFFSMTRNQIDKPCTGKPVMSEAAVGFLIPSAKAIVAVRPEFKTR